ncbi:Nn.00g078620.m01.CDS01 [Neocucurbitaria sp. VM-36]
MVIHNGAVCDMYTQTRISKTMQHIPATYLRTMTDQITPREKRTALETGSGINRLIAACNKNDRFKLLEDDGVLSADLENPVHPIFCWFSCDGPMKQMLQLASQFITHNSLLEFFVPLLYGHELTGSIGGTRKNYLSDPLANVTEARKKEYIAGVREALHCLGHSLFFQFVPAVGRVYARTRKYSCNIEIADYFASYYEQGRYAAASRCAQFRHDFLFAATLVHEVVHAIGVLRRGNLIEPHIRADSPDNEWGYGWEHFMFGNIINPQDRSKPGTHLLMRKVWADQKVAEEAGGKEYCGVPMSWIAQWFRKETWDIIKEQGPTAIPPPTARFKIQSSNKFSAWVISSDCADVKQDLLTLHNEWEQRPPRSETGSQSSEGSSPPPVRRDSSNKIYWRLRTPEELQKTNVPYIARIPKRVQQCLSCGQNMPGTKRSICCLPLLISKQLLQLS